MRTSRSIALSLATLGLMVGLWPAATASGSSGPLPWDGALETIVDFLGSVAAPAAFKVAVGAVVVCFAVSGNSTACRR